MENISTIQLIANIGFTLFGLVLVILVNVLFNRINDLMRDNKQLTKEVSELKVELPEKYMSKTDFQYVIDALFAKLDKIDDKLDRKADRTEHPVR